MRQNIIKIFIAVLVSTAAVSCASEDGILIFDMELNTKEIDFEISGMVTDKATEKPLENIKILVQAYDSSNNLYTQTAYTESDGKYWLLFDGKNRPSTIIVQTEDRNGEYESGKLDLVINYKSDINVKDGIFYINNCNFYLKKTE